MDDKDDVRTRFDALTEVPQGFWDLIAAARAEPEMFVKLTDDELVEFANEMSGLKTYFSHAPFHPPEEVYVSENTLDRAGAWVISQGQEFFTRVWREPRLFWNIIVNHEYLHGHNFEHAADRAWDERHGTDIPIV